MFARGQHLRVLCAGLLCLLVTAAAEPARYDGLTLAEWRVRIKNLDPRSPSSRSAVPGLMQIAADARVPSFTRRQAALTLGRIGPPARQSVPMLVELLTTPDVDDTTLVWVSKSLALFGREAVAATPTLARLVRDKRSGINRRAPLIEALANIGSAHPAAIPVLIELLSDPSDQTARLRELSAEAIAVVGSAASPAIPALIRCTRDKQEPVRRKSVMALGAMGPRAEIALPALVETLVFDESAAVRDVSAESLSRIGSPAVAPLSRLVRDRDPDVRWRAASALGRMRATAKSAVRVLTVALKDHSPLVQLSAVESLWKLTGDGPAVLPAVLRLLTSDDRTLRIRAYRLLIEMGPAALPARDSLQKMLTDPRRHVRSTAAQALRKLDSQ